MKKGCCLLLLGLLVSCGSKGHDSKMMLLLAFGASAGRGGPETSPDTAGNASTPTTTGPVVSAPIPMIVYNPPVSPVETDNDPNLICDESPATDFAPISIIKSSPGDGSVNVSIDAPLSVYFSQPLSCNTMPRIQSPYGLPLIGSVEHFTSAVLLREVGQVAKETNTIYETMGSYYRQGEFMPVQVSCKCNRVKIQPLVPLIPDTNYWILFSRELRSANHGFPGPDYNYFQYYLEATRQGVSGFTEKEIGEAESKGALVHFATGSDCPSVESSTDAAYDSTPFRFCSITPHSRTDVPTNTPVVLKFSKPVDCSVLNNWSVETIPEAGGTRSVMKSSSATDWFFASYTPEGMSGSGSFHSKYSCSGREMRIDPQGTLPEYSNSLGMLKGLSDAKRKAQAAPEFKYTPVQINGTWFSDIFIAGSGQWQWANFEKQPVCEDGEVLIEKKCVPEVNSDLPGSDRGGADGGPEVACPNRAITVDATQGKWFESADRRASKDSIKVGVHTYWADQNLILKIRNNCQAGWYKLSLTASNLDGPLPDWYKQFNVKVQADGVTLGGVSINASDTEYNRGTMLVYLKKGDTDLNLLWGNDAYAQGLYDANINLSDISLRYTETHKVSKSLVRSAAQYCDVAGRWFWEENSAFTNWDHQKIMFCFPGLKAGRYRITVEARNHVSDLPLPSDYKEFEIRLGSGNQIADTTIQADSKKFRNSSVEMDLENGAPIQLEWLNDRFEEGKSDTNIEIRKIKLTLIAP